MSLIACVQIQGSSDIEKNWRTTERLVRKAAGHGAKFVATPEATDYLGPHDLKMSIAEPLNGPRMRRYGALALELGIDLLIGSVAEAYSEEKCHNTSLLFNTKGELCSYYRKIHLFDVDLRSSGGVRFAESDRTKAGEKIVCTPTSVGKLGLSICFDLRFPELFRGLVQAGAEILAVPSAFTERTGRDHWHTLLKARAIETQSYIVAPGQWGTHDDNGLRASYGHSLIVDPWGTILAECSDGEGICMAEVNLNQLNRIRAQIPMESTRRL